MAVWELHVTAVLTTGMSFLRREVTFRKLGFARILGITWGHGRAWGPQILGTTISRTRSPKWVILERLQKEWDKPARQWRQEMAGVAPQSYYQLSCRL